MDTPVGCLEINRGKSGPKGAFAAKVISKQIPPTYICGVGIGVKMLKPCYV